jgi:tripartite-type tricarboxylate transporter receptor subunit TctC
MRILSRFIFSRVALLGAVIGFALAPGAWAQGTASDFPHKAIRIVVPFPAGGPVDILARVIAQRLNETWGQPVLVDNRAGAGGAIGAEFVAKSPADGHALLMSIAGTITIQPHLLVKKPFDPINDFAPVSQLVTLPFALVANPSVPATTVREVIALAKARPGRINFATSGIGTDYHLATELFKSLARIDIVPVPYKGGAPSLTAVIMGEADLGFQVISTALPHLRARKLKLIAVTSGKRSSALPQVPTMAEAGVAGYLSNGWWGILAPAGTPRETVNKLQGELAKILHAPDLKDRMLREGFELVAGTPEQFATIIRDESARWAKVVKDAQLTLD